MIKTFIVATILANCGDGSTRINYPILEVHGRATVTVHQSYYPIYADIKSFDLETEKGRDGYCDFIANENIRSYGFNCIVPLKKKED